MSDSLSVQITPPEWQATALEILFSQLSSAERAAQMSLTLAALRNRRVSFDGLLCAHRGARLLGAIWASSQGGRSALLWPPQVAAGEDESVAVELLSAADVWMSGNDISLATSYLASNMSQEAQRLAGAGYEQAAAVAYLLCESPDFPDCPVASHLEFERCEASDWRRLISIVDATYVDTCDCPRLDGRRDTRDVLEGYRTSGGYSPEYWLIVRSENRDVGCLLLADHKDENHFELVYMGVVPRERGRGLGTDITRHAQWLTKCAGRASLVLAVDSENFYAIRGYVACGFREWDRRFVFLKSIDGK